MIDFSTLQGLTIPEGVVTQITDASGRVLWVLSNEPVVLEVAKQTITTYAGETSYADECVVLLDIYPKKSNSTVKVTYGGLTKTLTFSGTNAQQVYFGTFNGVSDSVETPASGTLKIEGGYGGFACGSYQSGSKITSVGYCGCITAVNGWGEVKEISPRAFSGCKNLESITIPDSVTSIGEHSFYQCDILTTVEIPRSVISIDNYAFHTCDQLCSVVFNEGLMSIGDDAFSACGKLTSTLTIPSSVISIGKLAFNTTGLKTVVLLPTTPPTLGASNAFKYSSTVYNIIVPAGCGAVYRAAEVWSELADYITEAS